jgi:hypothetical protein
LLYLFTGDPSSSSPLLLEASSAEQKLQLLTHSFTPAEGVFTQLDGPVSSVVLDHLLRLSKLDESRLSSELKAQIPDLRDTEGRDLLQLRDLFQLACPHQYASDNLFQFVVCMMCVDVISFVSPSFSFDIAGGRLYPVSASA